MQPRPNAETSGPFFPRVRGFMRPSVARATQKKNAAENKTREKVWRCRPAAENGTKRGSPPRIHRSRLAERAGVHSMRADENLDHRLLGRGEHRGRAGTESGGAGGDA